MKTIEAQFFDTLNQVIEPLVRAGLGFPCLSPAGAIVLETTGRTSGKIINVPLLATRIGSLMIVSTVRGRSHWLRNVAAHPEVRYWLNGKANDASAYIFSPHIAAKDQNIPVLVSQVAKVILPQSRLFGVSFAILAPR